MGDFTADTTCLVADIGGTNTRVALADGTTLIPSTIQKFKNADFDSLESVLNLFVKSHGNVDCAAACVALAGPVRDGVGTLTNLDWAIDRDVLKNATRAEHVAILNDLQAQGHGLGHLDVNNIENIKPGATASIHSASLVVGVGTGFNAAAVFDGHQKRLVPPSECGHASLPVRNRADLELYEFINAQFHEPAIEDVLSGRGLERINCWLTGQTDFSAAESAAEIMAKMEKGRDQIADRVVQNFCRILGNVTGDLSLVHLPFGGVYLVGGVARAMAPYLKSHGFIDAFSDKGRFKDFMDQFSVSVIHDDWAALIGCAHHMDGLTR